MPATLAISEQVYRDLAQQARRLNQSPDKLAEQLLRRHLSSQARWRKEFESLLARIQARTTQYSSEEIEADISAAAAEVKELRCGHRRAG